MSSFFKSRTPNENNKAAANASPISPTPLTTKESPQTARLSHNAQPPPSPHRMASMGTPGDTRSIRINTPLNVARSSLNGGECYRVIVLCMGHSQLLTSLFGIHPDRFTAPGTINVQPHNASNGSAAGTPTTQSGAGVRPSYTSGSPGDALRRINSTNTTGARGSGREIAIRRRPSVDFQGNGLSAASEVPPALFTSAATPINSHSQSRTSHNEMRNSITSPLSPAAHAMRTLSITPGGRSVDYQHHDGQQSPALLSPPSASDHMQRQLQYDGNTPLSTGDELDFEELDELVLKSGTFRDLYRLVRMCAAQPSCDRIVALIERHAKHLVNAHTVRLCLVQRDGLAHAQYNQPQPLDAGVIGDVRTRREIANLTNPASDSRWSAAVDCPSDCSDNGANIRSMIVIPIEADATADCSGKKDVVAVLQAVREQQATPLFTTRDCKILYRLGK